jgi:TonB family protein
MLKRVSLALACAAVFTTAALADTSPVMAGLRECDLPTVPEGGHVRFEFKVSAAGVVSDVKVLESSGNAGSDARAAKCVASYTWKPATHDGQPVDGIGHYALNFGARIQDLEGAERAFMLLERDADRRCHKLFPIDRRFDLPGQPITLVAVARLASGEVQTKIMQSAGAKADANATKCMLQLVGDRTDLPTTFVRTFSVDWSHR